MKPKLKECSGCGNTTVIWKAKTSTHGQMCKGCWASFRAPESDDHDKVKAKAVQKKKRSPIAPISEKKAKELVEYRRVRDEYMKTHPTCEVRSEVCTGKSEDLHHKKPRAYHLMDVSVFMAVCRSCHQKIERDDKWARENGFKLNHL
jgi:homoserine trans-succinylase